MKKIILKIIIAAIVLLIFNLLATYIIIWFFPNIAEEYYNPVFSIEGYKSTLYFIHPLLVSFALAWFWQRFKTLFHGSFWLRGLEVGLAYGAIAVLPSMWLIFCSLSVSIDIVLSWLLYGIIQGIVVGIIYAKINP
jgi:hypothetical protein